MQWASWADFLAMGGYGFYVWGSFGACAVLMALEPFLVVLRQNEIRRNVARERLANELDQGATSEP